MATNTVYRQGKATVTIPAGAALAVWSPDVVSVSRLGTYTQYPNQAVLIGQSLPGQQLVTSTFSSGATLIIEAGADEVLYEIGTAPVVQYPQANSGQMPALAAQVVNTSATLTVANLLGQVITSTTAAAVTGTLPTGTVMDAGSSLNVGDYFDFSVVATGANAFTIATASGWTVGGAGGSAVVATVTSGRFRALKTATATYVLYRLS
jgi:hypothetical protein